jgi:hypothetical protein
MEEEAMTELDQDLVRRARRAPRKDELSEGERIAMNVFWRSGVRVPVLSRIFGCARNTVYYNCLTGDQVSYPSNRAIEINEFVEKIGVGEAYRRYVTPEMVKAVNAANEALAAEHEYRAKRRARRDAA